MKKNAKPFSETYLGQLREKVGSRTLIVPGVRVVIENEAGEILLQKRADIDIWGLPGGGTEEGESIQAVLEREVREETGLKVLDYRPVGFSSRPEIEIFTYPNGHRIHSFAFIFQVTKWSGELDFSNEESRALQFFAQNELPEMLPNERLSLDHYFIFRENGAFQII